MWLGPPPASKVTLSPPQGVQPPGPPTRGLRQRAGLSIPAARSRTPSSCTDGAPLGPNTYKLGTKVIPRHPGHSVSDALTSTRQHQGHAESERGGKGDAARGALLQGHPHVPEGGVLRGCPERGVCPRRWTRALLGAPAPRSPAGRLPYSEPWSVCSPVLGPPLPSSSMTPTVAPPGLGSNSRDRGAWAAQRLSICFRVRA